MNIIKKIEEIRQLPEHIRIRYVWGCVAVSMFIIALLWLFSIVSMFSRVEDKQETSSETPNFTDQLKQLKENAPSLKDLQQPLGSEEEGIKAQGKTGIQNSSSIDSMVPASNGYSDIKNTEAER